MWQESEAEGHRSSSPSQPRSWITVLTEQEIDKFQQLERDPHFVALTAKQRVFLRTYLETAGDKRLAFKASGYNAKNDNTREAFISRLLANPNIRALIQEYFGFGDLRSQLQKEELLRILAGEIRRAQAKGTSLTWFIPLLRMYVEMKGWVNPPKAVWTPSKPRKNVTQGQKAMQKGLDKSGTSLLDLVNQLEGNDEQSS